MGTLAPFVGTAEIVRIISQIGFPFDRIYPLLVSQVGLNQSVFAPLTASLLPQLGTHYKSPNMAVVILFRLHFLA